jgi:ribosomal protein L11 methyltransferase
MALPIYHQFQFETDEPNSQLLIAFLTRFDFESFEETESGVNGYIQDTAISEEFRLALIQELSHLFKSFSEVIIKNENWNEKWESQFQPIRVGNFCGVRATFHEAMDNVQYELIIDPKMAFGTGHHATTWMMIDKMAKLDFAERKVLDFGAGTAILSILAEKMGAFQIDAVEIEEPAVINAAQNLKLNACKNIEVIPGDIQSIPEGRYDVILANINRFVLLESLSLLSGILWSSGVILLSGILESDKLIMEEAIHNQELRIRNLQQKGEWLCFELTK